MLLDDGFQLRYFLFLVQYSILKKEKIMNNEQGILNDEVLK